MKTDNLAIFALVGITVASPLLGKEASNLRTRRVNDLNNENDASVENLLNTNSLISEIISRNIELQGENAGTNNDLSKRHDDDLIGGGILGGGSGSGGSGSGGRSSSTRKRHEDDLIGGGILGGGSGSGGRSSSIIKRQGGGRNGGGGGGNGGGNGGRNGGGNGGGREGRNGGGREGRNEDRSI